MPSKDLSPLDQVKRYRNLAADARREAETGPAAARGAYLLIAEQWDELANEIEANVKAGNLKR